MKIEQLKIQIRNQYKTKSKLFLKSQIDQIKKQTEKLEENLIDLEMEKKSLLC